MFCTKGGIVISVCRCVHTHVSDSHMCMCVCVCMSMYVCAYMHVVDKQHYKICEILWMI